MGRLRKRQGLPAIPPTWASLALHRARKGRDMNKIILAMVIAIGPSVAPAKWNGPPEQWASHASYTCEVMMRDLDDALEKGLALNNSNSGLVNWVMDFLWNGDRSAKLIIRHGSYGWRRP